MDSPTVKRKPEIGEEGRLKRLKLNPQFSRQFRANLFEGDVLESYIREYANSKPYKHGVISNLIDPYLARAVRNEIQTSLSFTEKETDIYKILQTGDLANLDGLEESSLLQLPSLLALRNALYSEEFRSCLARITGSGPLSGQKTDMAINVYTAGCHLLCHDDVIGSRRVSYILYLTDPDNPWQEEWGGALRLYPTETISEGGVETKTPLPDHSLSIPPAFNQLSFFTVQPGESFHDVEEVYHRAGESRTRMAISGWYHIPQIGEEGYEEGLEEKLAEKSSLVQLQGNDDRFDLPKEVIEKYEETGKAETLTEEDLDHLLKYIAPTFLTPDTLEEMSGSFADESVLQVGHFLSAKFSDRLRRWLEDAAMSRLPRSSEEIEYETEWKVARPPHKHRYLYQHGKEREATDPGEEGGEDKHGEKGEDNRGEKEGDNRVEEGEEDKPPEEREEDDRGEQRGEDIPGEDREVDKPGEEKQEDIPVEERKEDNPGEQREENKPLEEKEEDNPGEQREEDNPEERQEDHPGEEEELDDEDEGGDDGEEKEGYISERDENFPEKVLEWDDLGEEKEWDNPLQEILTQLIPSGAFRRWLSLATGLAIEDHQALARRFRRGMDYTLATGGAGAGPAKVEMTLGITPPYGEEEEEEEDMGGHEIYMSADGGDANETNDPAVYKSTAAYRPRGRSRAVASEEDDFGYDYDEGEEGRRGDGDRGESARGEDEEEEEDEGILTSAPPGWNKLSIVLRDSGTLKFVKYLSRGARSDRWDVAGVFGVGDEGEGEGEGGEVGGEDGEGGEEGEDGGGEVEEQEG